MGPNVPVGNLTSFAVYDFDGDGKCEIAVRTAEGTVFGDGTEIKDTDGDGKVDYRVEGSAHIHGGPEFLSVLDGMTGRELARTDYIALGKSEDWGDNYYKRSASYRVGVGCFGYYPLYSDLSWSIWKDGIGSLGFSGPRVKEEMAIRYFGRCAR